MWEVCAHMSVLCTGMHVGGVCVGSYLPCMSTLYGCSNLKVITMTTMITTTISTTTPTSTPPTAPPMAAPELAAPEPVPPMGWGGEEGGRWTWWW